MTIYHCLSVTSIYIPTVTIYFSTIATYHYLGTMGSAYTDYAIVDAVVLPAELSW